MSRFHFKLEFLLRFRRQKEETAMYELAQRVREANEIEGRINDLNDENREVGANIRRLGAQGVPAAVFGMYTEYQSHLHDQSRQAGRQLAQAERKIDQQRRTLIALSVDRKVIEQYKERCKTAFECEQELKDQKNLDELAALARDRRKRLHEENE